MPCEARSESRDGAKVFPEAGPVDCRGELFNFLVGLEPDGKGASKESASFVGKDEDAAAAVVGIALDFKQATAFKWFQRGGKRGAIHCEQGSDRTHRGRLRAIERHKEGELPIGEFEGAKFFVETTAKGARCTLHMKAKTAIFDH